MLKSAVRVEHGEHGPDRAKKTLSGGERNQRFDPGEEPSGGPDHHGDTMAVPTSSNSMLTSSCTVAWPAALFVTLVGAVVVLWSLGGARPQSV